MSSFRAWKTEEILRFFAGFFFCLCAMTLAYAAVEHLLGKARFHEGSLAYIVFTTLPLHGSILGGTAACLWLSGLGWSQAFGFSRPNLVRAISWGVVAALVFIPAGMALETFSLVALDHVPPKILTTLHIKIEQQAAVDEFKHVNSSAGRAYLVVFAVLIAPLAEEILFRGFLYRGLRQLGLRRFAYWGSAFLFAAIHGNAPIFIPIFVLGLLLAWLYEKNQNLLASFTAHSLFNAINVIFILYGDDLLHSYQRHFQIRS